MAKCIKCTLEIYMDKNICPVCGQVQNKDLELLGNSKLMKRNSAVKVIPFLLILLIIIIFSIIYLTSIPAVTSRDNSPIDVTNDPVQKVNSKTNAVYVKKGSNTFYLLPMADYEISAVVVGKQNYDFDNSSVLSKIDLLLIWGDLTKKNIRDTFKFSQYGRFGFYTTKTPNSIDLSYASTHISNNHIIPSSNNIQKAINKLKIHDSLVITGYLVNISGENKGKDFVWESSLTRTDDGDGACEVIYVTKVKVGSKVYQ